MPYYFLSSVLVRPTQAARLFLLRFLRTCRGLVLVQAAEGPSYPTRLESFTPASLLVEQQQQLLQTNFFILSEHLSQTETQHQFFFSPIAILFLTWIRWIVTMYQGVVRLPDCNDHNSGMPTTTDSTSNPISLNFGVQDVSKLSFILTPHSLYFCDFTGLLSRFFAVVYVRTCSAPSRIYRRYYRGIQRSRCLFFRSSLILVLVHVGGMAFQGSVHVKFWRKTAVVKCGTVMLPPPS